MEFPQNTKMDLSTRANYSLYFSRIIDCLILLLAIWVLLFVGDNNSELPFIGFIIITLSVYLCIKVKENILLLLLFSVLAFINISISYSDLIKLGLFVADWQIPFRATYYNAIAAKSILIFLAILNIFFNSWVVKNKQSEFIIVRKDNPIIALVGLASLFVILFTGYGQDIVNSDAYVSNNNTLYEYSSIIFIITWLYSGKNKFINIMLLLYTMLYVFQSFFYGDRSAAFLVLILYLLLYFRHKLSLTKIIIFSIIAIVFSNFIGEFRQYRTENISQVMSSAVDRGLYSDTVSYAYYTSLTLVALKDYDPNLKSIFIEYLKGYILGSSKSKYTNLAIHARDTSKVLFNRGGGLYPTHFYAFFGYAGVIISSIFLSLVLRYFFLRKGNVINLYQIIIVTYAIRWYLYNPINIFRTILIVFSILLLVCIYFDKISKKKEEKSMNLEVTV